MFEGRRPDKVLNVVGMMCQKNCGSTVERALRQVPKVLWAVAIFAENIALIWGDPKDSDLLDALDAVGFDASIKTDDACPMKASAMNPVESEQSPDITLKIKIPNQKDRRVSKEKIQESLLSVDGVTSTLIKRESEDFIVCVWGFIDKESVKAALLTKGYSAFDPHEDTRLKKENGKRFSQESSVISPIRCSTRIVDLKVSGMSCASCVKGIEKDVMKLLGVKSIRVALLTEKVEITFEEDVVKVEDITSTISALGYKLHVVEIRELGEGIKRELNFRVTGMSCANCALKIESTLRKLPGVVSADVSCMTDKARVLLNEDLNECLGPRDIIEHIVKQGYGCEICDEGKHDSKDSNDELVEWGRLLMLTLFLGLPVIILHLAMLNSKMIMMMYKTPAVCDGGISAGQVLMILFNVPLQFGVGYRYYRSAYLGAIHGNFGMDFLVVTGTSISFIYSFVQLFFACSTGIPTDHVFLESSGMLLTFVTVGKYMEVYAKGKSASAITNLLLLQPTQAILVLPSEVNGDMPISKPKSEKGGYGTLDEEPDSVSAASEEFTINMENEITEDIKLDLVQRGDILKVLPGSRVPTDGHIVYGNSYIDESMITGESVPVLRKKGDIIFGSTLNQSGLIYMRVSSVGSESALAQIVKLVEAAQMTKAPVQAYADKIAGVFTPIILFLSCLTFIVWMSLTSMHIVPKEWYEDEYGDPMLFSMLFGISVVVISCPCALGLATPTAIMVGTSVGAWNGILIKGGPAFETAHKITTVVFDKTGTLTEGQPTVTDVVILEGSSNGEMSIKYTNSASIIQTDEDALLQYAASLEQGSEHPLADAIVRAAKKRSIKLLAIQDDSFNSIPGRGLSCRLKEGGHTVIVGNRLFLESCNLTVGAVVDAAMWDLEVQGKTAVCVAVNNIILGVLGIADVAKPEALSTIAYLRNMGVDVWMVTGDNKTTAEAMAAQLEIPRDRVISGAMPADKVTKIEEMQAKGQSVAMIGDGINDSPALARADLGIAIGAGTHVAVEAANFVLVRNNLHDVIVALDLARVVFSRIRLNFLWAIVYNIIAIPFAAGVWFPWTHKLVPPQYAGLSMALSSISVVASSFSLRCYTRPTIYIDPNKRHAKMQDSAVRIIKKKGSQYSKVKLDDSLHDQSSHGVELGMAFHGRRNLSQHVADIENGR